MICKPLVRHVGATQLSPAVFSLLVLIAGCGGGGGGGDPKPQPTATRTATASAAATATQTATSTSAAATATATSTAIPTLTISPTAAASQTVPPTSTSTSTPTQPPEVPTATFSPTETATSLSTPTPTATPLIGPIVAAFGIADVSGTFDTPGGSDTEGRPIFTRRSASGFVIFVEGRPGVSRLPVGSTRYNYKSRDPSAQPDLQMLSSTDLGNATRAVCDNAFPVAGGVPAIEPPRFETEAAVSDALNDLGCRFKLFAETDFACTQDSRGNYVFANASSTAQFCTLVDDALTFPVGETVLTVRLRDIAGNAGAPVQIVVRVTGMP